MALVRKYKRINLRPILIMRGKLQSALVILLAAGVFIIIALTTQSPSEKGPLLPSLKAFATTNPETLKTEISEIKKKVEIEKALSAQNELYRQLNSGPRTVEEIEKELSDLTSREEKISFSKDKIDRAYRLSMVTSHIYKSGDNSYHVVFIHSFANNSLPEDEVTLFTRKIDGAEENLSHAQLVLHRNLEISSSGEPTWLPQSRSAYSFALAPNKIKRAFDLREPDGIGGFSPLQDKTFDPLSILTVEGAQFENGSYQQELISPDGAIINVKVSIRKTQIGTLTFHIETQELNSKIQKNFILVYEEI